MGFQVSEGDTVSHFIEFQDVCKYYTMGEHKIAAADHVSFYVEKGEFCIIVGPSGAGKTTVLNMLGGMDTCDEGKILLDGQEISGYNQKQLTTYPGTTWASCSSFTTWCRT